MKKAVVLLSGGLDSTTTLAIAEEQGYELYALSFDYGQRHKVELDLAGKAAEKIGVKKHLFINFDLRGIGGSALTSDIKVPKGSAEEKETRIPLTYVPARNTIFLSFALSWAETLEAEDIFIGVNAVDYSGYPDCRPEFIQAFQDMANLATKVSVEGTVKFNIRTPLIDLTKAGIIKKGTQLGVDYSLAWSCYDPVEKDGKYLPCMQCDSCQLRAKGFEEAGIEDPL
jgi:7-cyano-7-deazaguanine synthase